HLDQRAAEAENVPKAHVALGKAACGDVLTEGAGLRQQRRRGINVTRPGGVVVKGIVVDRLLWSAMMARIALFVTGESRRRHRDGTVAHLLRDAGKMPRRREGRCTAGQDGSDGDAARRVGRGGSPEQERPR